MKSLPYSLLDPHGFAYFGLMQRGLWLRFRHLAVWAFCTLAFCHHAHAQIPSVKDESFYNKLIPKTPVIPRPPESEIAWKTSQLPTSTPKDWMKSYKDPTVVWTLDAQGRRIWHVFTDLGTTGDGQLNYIQYNDQWVRQGERLLMTYRFGPKTPFIEAIPAWAKLSCNQAGPHIFYHSRKGKWYLLYQHKLSDNLPAKDPRKVDPTQYLAFQEIEAPQGINSSPITLTNTLLSGTERINLMCLSPSSADGDPPGLMGLPKAMMKDPNATNSSVIKEDFGMFDSYLIDDGEYTYIYYANDMGLAMFSRILSGDFPGKFDREDKEGRNRYVGKWDEPKVAICEQNNSQAFEGLSVYTLPKDASGTYRKIPDPKTGLPTAREAKYMLLMECVNYSTEVLGPNRFFRAWLSDRLDFGVRSYAEYEAAGPSQQWVRWWDSQDGTGSLNIERAFAGPNNLEAVAGVQPWTISVSHGDMARMNNDERMILDLDNPVFVYQGHDAGSRFVPPGEYFNIPYKLGILTPAPKTLPGVTSWATTTSQKWSAGAAWTQGLAPYSRAGNRLHLGTGPVLPAGTLVSTQDISTDFRVTELTLGGNAPATGNAVFRVVGDAVGDGINFVHYGNQTPVFNLNGLGGRLRYDIATPLNVSLGATVTGDGTAVFDVSGGFTVNGTLKKTGSATLGVSALALACTASPFEASGVFQQWGGTVKVSTLTLGLNEELKNTPRLRATYTLGEAATAGTPVLAAGSLVVGSGGTRNSASTSRFEWNCGVLTHRDATTDLLVAGRDATASGRLTVALGTTSSRTLRVDAGRSATMGPTVLFTGSGTGSILDKTGDGTWVLNAVLQHTGITTITAGTLAGAPAFAGALSVASAGRLAPGGAVAGTITAPSVQLAGTLVVAAPSGSDQLTTGGLLNLLAGARVEVATPLVAPMVIARYGTLSGTFASVPAGYTVNYAYNDGTSTKNIALLPPTTYSAWITSIPWGTASSARTADPDKDGQSNVFEYALGTDPLVYNAPLAASINKNGFLQLVFNRRADPFITYRVESCANVAAGVWSTVMTSTGTANVAGPVTVVDNVAMGVMPARYLRLVVHKP